QEELILLAVWKLKGNAYGITIREHLKKITGKKMSIGAIYVPLDRLAHKGYLKAYQGAPTPERGGMSKRYYEVTPEGFKALKQAKELHDTMWDDLPDTELEGENLI
ncbi:PadR family transcriptional regulator, partial [candidate division KSB1 bacterium]